uniref:E2 ubiquitin-conjugating enzyme n=1 Tax=Opuntia streptacantha TaxID=393608 RepID=A0A7C8Z0J4_OPUST
MEDPPIAIHTPHNSKKRFFAASSGGGGSSSFADPDVIEIPPPATWKSKPLKQKSIVDPEVIVVDDEDYDDIMIIDEKVAPKSKGKQPVLNHFGGNTMGTDKGVSLPEANGFVKGSPLIFDDDFSGLALFDEECAMLQAYFDSVDIQSGVEATVPWWPVSTASVKQAVSASSSSVFGTVASSNIAVSDSESWSSPEPLQSKKSVSNSIHVKPKPPLPVVQSNSSSHMQASSVSPAMHGGPSASAHSHKKRATWSTSSKLPSLGTKHWSGWENAFHGYGIPSVPQAVDSSAFLSSWDCSGGIRLDDSISAGIRPVSTEGQGDTNENPILKKLEQFKKFDSVEDHSGHFYNSRKESHNQPSSWKKKINAEWKMLERDLPDTIYVRVYEARMDLLRAVIVGADGTPYHDGLFFFDVYFTPSYPNTPPIVKYHAHGLRLNPNLYNCGKVCLSLLGTWSGSGSENWLPGTSNMLQVLVSIQALILNAEPYYNEPGYAFQKSNSMGSSMSDNYSENTFLLSLKTMLYTMRNPPKPVEHTWMV